MKYTLQAHISAIDMTFSNYYFGAVSQTSKPNQQITQQVCFVSLKTAFYILSSCRTQSMTQAN